VKQVTSDALGPVNRALGLTGSPASGETEFLDSVVFQSLDVAQIVRRGRTLASSQGFFLFQMDNLHGAAETLASTIEPYNPGAGFAFPPYPDTIPPQFDLWMLGASVFRVSGTGTLTATLSIRVPAAHIGVGVDDSAATVTPAIALVHVAFWDAIISVSNEFAILNGENGPYWKGAIRLRRDDDTQVRFISVSSAIATYRMSILFGMFPLSLGQDLIA